MLFLVEMNIFFPIHSLNDNDKNNNVSQATIGVFFFLYSALALIFMTKVVLDCTCSVHFDVFVLG